MPISYSIQRGMRTVITTMTGSLSIQELLDFCDELAADLRFEPEFNQLIEATAGAGANLHSEGLDAVRRSDPFSHQSKRAIVVRSEEDYAVARIYAVMWGEEKMRVFRSREEALTYLDLPHNRQGEFTTAG